MQFIGTGLVAGLLCSRGRHAAQLRDGAMNFTRESNRPSAAIWSFSGEYIWKYTHNGYDFSVLGDTPITFPVEWHNPRFLDSPAASACPTFTASPR